MVAAADEAVFGEMEGHAEENGAVDHGADEGELDAEVQKNLQTLFELVFTYMQIYANTFEMEIEWPVAWANFVEKLYLPFSLELSLFVPTVPGIGEGKLYSRTVKRVLAHKVRRKLTTNAFEGSNVSLLLRRDPESFSVAGRKREAR
jgi:hypothetical protein